MQGILTIILIIDIKLAVNSTSEFIKIFIALFGSIAIICLAKVSILAIKILFLDIKLEKLRKQINELRKKY